MAALGLIMSALPVEAGLREADLFSINGVSVFRR
jgi:hypothetical protein